MTDKDKAPAVASASKADNSMETDTETVAISGLGAGSVSNAGIDLHDSDVCVPVKICDEFAHTLRFPFSYDGKDINKLVMRRPKLMDKHLAEGRSDDNFDIMVDVLSAVCCVDEDLLLEVDEEYDFVQLLKCFKQFKETADIESTTLILTYPFVIPAKGKNKARDITEITLRRPNLRDSMSYKKEKMGDKIARLAGFKKSELLGMDLKTDWEGLVEIYESFQRRISR